MDTVSSSTLQKKKLRPKAVKFVADSQQATKPELELNSLAAGFQPSLSGAEILMGLVERHTQSGRTQETPTS